MIDTKERLKDETRKWEKKLQTRLKDVDSADEDGAELLENARAYLNDVDHFRDQEDWVRAFEAVIWGWSWLEIGERLEKIKEE